VEVIVRSLALANQKGGVGKTTTAIHLAHGLAMAGGKVALLDLDPQGNAAVGIQGMVGSESSDLHDRELPMLREVSPGFWLSADHGTEPDLAGLRNLAGDLDRAGFDWLIADCPPRMDAWGWAGLAVCREVLVPVQAEFFAMHGLSQMMATLERARTELPGHGALLGVLPTIVDWSEPVCREVVEDLRRNLGPAVLDTMILRDSRVVEAASHGKTLFAYRPHAKAALCFGELIREVANGRS
jgi:chromosome partitioning protein